MKQIDSTKARRELIKKKYKEMTESTDPDVKKRIAEELEDIQRQRFREMNRMNR